MATGIVLALLALAVLVAVVLLLRRSARDTVLPFGGGRDPWLEWQRRHRLSAAEAREIARAVERGRAFEEPRLRAAAADRAAVQLRMETPGPRTRRLLWACVVVALVLLVVAVSLDGLDAVGFHYVIWVLLGFVTWRRRRNVRRSLVLNGGEPDEPASVRAW